MIQPEAIFTPVEQKRVIVLSVIRRLINTDIKYIFNAKTLELIANGQINRYRMENAHNFDLILQFFQNNVPLHAKEIML